MRVLITGATGFVGYWMKRTMPKDIEYIGVGRDAYESGLLDMVVGITHIVHLAPVSPSVVVELARKHNARLLYCSSGIVYYPFTYAQYRHDKIVGELMCRDSGLDYVIARLFTFFGKRLDDKKAISQLFQAARLGGPIRVCKNVTRSYMHGAEMGRQMWKILFDGERERAYDVGSKRPVTTERIARRIQAFTGCKIEYIDIPTELPYYVPRGNNGILDRD